MVRSLKADLRSSGGCKPFKDAVADEMEDDVTNLLLARKVFEFPQKIYPG
jgi:hypothetical protein